MVVVMPQVNLALHPIVQGRQGQKPDDIWWWTCKRSAARSTALITLLPRHYHARIVGTIMPCDGAIIFRDLVGKLDILTTRAR
jgi:hypothetical protein